MTSFKTFAALMLLLLSDTATALDENCVGIEELGTPNLDRYDYSVSMDVDDDCEYALNISFKHDESIPMVTDPLTQCDPSSVPTEIASDGLPYFAFRWGYESMPEEIKQTTGIDHISIDWNSCGHPPVELFAAPHYDLHIYRESPEFRTCMTCTTAPDAPMCDPTPGAQTTPSGKAFFDIARLDRYELGLIQRSFGPDLTERDPDKQPKNMPAGYVVGMTDMIPLMGGHAWDLNQVPRSSQEWMDPIWVMGPYNGGIIDYEPMIPMSFFSGADNEFSEELSYEDQTIDTLPSSYTVTYDSTSKTISLKLTGTSASGTCIKKVNNVMDEDSMQTMDSDESIAESGSISFLPFAPQATASIIMMASFFLS